MSDLETQLLNTEEALNSILGELKDLQDSAAQIEKAKDISVMVVRSCEEINTKILDLLHGAEAFLKYIEQARIQEELGEIKKQNLETQTDISSLGNVLQKSSQEIMLSIEKLAEHQKEFSRQTTSLHADLLILLKENGGQLSVIGTNLLSVKEQIQSLKDLGSQWTAKTQADFSNLNKRMAQNRIIGIIFLFSIFLFSVVNLIVLLIRK